MAYSITVETYEDFENIILNRDLNMVKAIIEIVLKNLKTRKKNIHVLTVTITSEDKIVDITVEKSNFIDTLEKNLKTLIHYEEYELCSKVRDAIETLKK